MTPADLKIRREALGLAQGFIASAVGVQDRAVRRWEAGDSPIPDDVAALLFRVELQTDELLDAAEDTALEFVESQTVELGGPPTDIAITAYATDRDLWTAHPNFRPLPASWHRMMLSRLSERLADSTGIPVVFQFAPHES